MGVLAGLGGALAWALSSTLLATQTRKTNSLTATAIRVSAAAVFVVVMMFALAEQDDIASMSALDILQFGATGMVNFAIGETLYTASVAALGLTRSFTTVIGTYNLTAFGLGAALLGETINLQIGVGAVLILAGVFLVAAYGRAAHDGPRAETEAAAGATGPGEIRMPLVGALRATATLGIIFGLLAGVAWGAGAVWLRHVSEGFDTTAVSAMRMPPAMLLLIAIAVAQASVQTGSGRGRTPGRWLGRISGRTLVIVGLSGILAQGVAGLLFIVALGEIGAGQTVVLFATASLWGLVMGAIVLREAVTRWVVVGSVLAVAGIALLAL